jgi:glycosyltransferase involved in cell wall biosynthesis
LTRSLSVLLPVHNAQSTLEADVGQMLDLLPELTHDFDLVIIDDGSTDATCEVAHELATQFPQVKYHRHSRRRGADIVIRESLTRTQSQVVLAHNGQPRIDAGEVLRAWHGQPAAVRPIDAGNFQILRRDAGQSTGPFRAIHRVEPHNAADSAGKARSVLSRRPNFLSRIKDFALGE